MKGLEPPRPETLDPKSNAATITPHAQKDTAKVKRIFELPKFLTKIVSNHGKKA